MENLHKRLEEAKEEYILNSIKATNDDFDEIAALGYKEAVKVAKELLEKKLVYVPMEGFITDFEAEMNKLWEETK